MKSQFKWPSPHFFNQRGAFILLKSKNYFAWTANFGVVPLFLLDAFLFAPMFFFFLSLLVSVTHVRETIINSLKNKQKSFDKDLFLPIKLLCVKGILINGVYAKDIFLIIGPKREFYLPKIKNFKVFHPEFISYGFDDNRKILSVYGKKSGESQIHIKQIDQKAESEIIHIHVQNFKMPQKASFLFGMLDELGLDIKMIGDIIHISGEINNRNQYLTWHKIKIKFQELKIQIVDDTALSDLFWVTLKGEIFESFFKSHYEEFSCDKKNADIICQIFPENLPSQDLLKLLKKNLSIQFIKTTQQELNTNLIVKIKMIQVENQNGFDLNFGLNQVTGNLGDFFSKPLDSIIKQNEVQFAEKKIVMATLAGPEIKIRPNELGEIQLGSENAYRTGENKNPKVVWKFAGLKMSFKCQNLGQKIKINYQTELTEPQSDESGNTSHVSGSKTKASIILPLSSAQEVFRITLKSKAIENEGIPLLGSIPILGLLFKSDREESHYKTIFGIIKVEKE